MSGQVGSVFIYIEELSVFLVMTPKQYDTFLTNFLNRADWPDHIGQLGIFYLDRLLVSSIFPIMIPKWYDTFLTSFLNRPDCYQVYFYTLLILPVFPVITLMWYDAFLTSFPNRPYLPNRLGRLVIFLPWSTINFFDFSSHDAKVIWYFLNWFYQTGQTGLTA